jgi:pimeloyl-ACP methyl ester carboxylesterase
MTPFAHRQVLADGATMHVVECGREDSPVVIFCHGFPESWYSWRHQLTFLAEQGYRAIALDMRGYGRSYKPLSIGAYATLDHVGDVVGVLNELDIQSAVVVGHDHGGPVAWMAATVRPDLFRGVAVLSVPRPPHAQINPAHVTTNAFGEQWFYANWFQEPGVAEAALDSNVRRFLRDFFYTLSGDCPGEPLRGLAGGIGGDIFGRLSTPEILPSWFTAEDLTFYVDEFERSGFRGGLNWYRCTRRNWELGRVWADVRIDQPALFIAGERDCVLALMPGWFEAMSSSVPGLTDAIVLPGCGHWTQQERPDDVNRELVRFLKAIG